MAFIKLYFYLDECVKFGEYWIGEFAQDYGQIKTPQNFFKNRAICQIKYPPNLI